MEDYNVLCPNFLRNPHINPLSNVPIRDEDFDFYQNMCKDYGFNLSLKDKVKLVYLNKYYGKRMCSNFLDNKKINPFDGSNIIEGNVAHTFFLNLCDYYNMNKNLPLYERKIKTTSKYYNPPQKEILSGPEYTNKLPNKNIIPRLSQVKLLPEYGNMLSDKNIIPRLSPVKLLPLPYSGNMLSDKNIIARQARRELLPVSEYGNVLSDKNIIARPARRELLPVPEYGNILSDKNLIHRPARRELLPVSEYGNILSDTNLIPIPARRELLPVPEYGNILSDINLIPRHSRRELLPNENILNMNLKQIINNLNKDNILKNQLTKNLTKILEKNANYNNNLNRYILSKSETEKKYGIKQFMFDLLKEEEIDLVNKILDFFELDYVDLLDILLEFPKYATDEYLLMNYFNNIPSDADWSNLGEIFNDVYGNWLIEDKLKLLILLINVALLTNNEFVLDELIKVYNEWREGIQDEIEDIEDFDEKDKIIDLVEILDILSIK